jgi:hypothetical protein
MTNPAQFPRGQITPDDEGAIEMRIAVSPDKKTMILQFRYPVGWIGLGKEDALALAKMLTDKASEMDDGPPIIA